MPPLLRLLPFPPLQPVGRPARRLGRLLAALHAQVRRRRRKERGGGRAPASQRSRVRALSAGARPPHTRSRGAALQHRAFVESASAFGPAAPARAFVLRAACRAPATTPPVQSLLASAAPPCAAPARPLAPVCVRAAGCARAGWCGTSGPRGCGRPHVYKGRRQPRGRSAHSRPRRPPFWQAARTEEGPRMLTRGAVIVAEALPVGNTAAPRARPRVRVSFIGCGSWDGPGRGGWPPTRARLRVLAIA